MKCINVVAADCRYYINAFHLFITMFYLFPGRGRARRLLVTTLGGWD